MGVQKSPCGKKSNWTSLTSRKAPTNGKIRLCAVGNGKIVEDSWDIDVVLGEDAGKKEAVEGSSRRG